MTHANISLDRDQTPTRRRPSILRGMVRLLLLACLVLMVLVILSDPRMMAQVESAVDQLAARLDQSASSETTGNAELPAATLKDGEKPSVSAMPQNQVPVLRTGSDSN